MAENQTVATKYHPDKTLNEVLDDLGLYARPTKVEGVRSVHTKRHGREQYTGRAHEIWGWLTICPGCAFRGFKEEACECGCGGTGKRPYFNTPFDAPVDVKEAA